MVRAFAAALGVAILALPVLARAEEDQVRVDVAGGHEVVLERAIEGTNLWESVCVGTCTTMLPREGRYRVTGHDARPSLPLAFIPGRDNTVRLDAAMVYRSGWIGGILLTVLGPITGIAGGLAIALQQQQPTFEPPCSSLGCPSGPATSNAIPIAGGLTVGVGIVMTVAGVIALIVTDHSTARQRGFAALSGRSLTITF